MLAASAFAGFRHWQARNEPVDPMTVGDGRAAALELDAAAAQLELVKSTPADTYDGPDLKNFRGMTRVWADELSYCIEVVRGTRVYFERGPGGTAAPGACPRR